MESNIWKQVFIHSQHTESYYSLRDAPCILWQINNTTIVLHTHTNHPAVSGFLHLSDINHFTKYDCLRTIKKMRGRRRCQTQIKQHFFNSSCQNRSKATFVSAMRLSSASHTTIYWKYIKKFASSISERIKAK